MWKSGSLTLLISRASLLQVEVGMRNGNYELVKAPADYPGRKYRGRYCYEHHLVWWINTGEVPNPNQVLHHKNGDTRDNRFCNLELLSWRRHSSEHTAKRGKAMVEMRCPSCGTMFVRERRQTHLVKGGQLSFCSRSCAGRRPLPNGTEVIREYRSGVT